MVRAAVSVPRWHQAFLAMLPVIETHARCVFRHLDAEARQEAVQEVVCNALKAYVRLVQLKKTDIAYPTALARYAVAQFRDGRKVGNRMNVRDISSAYCQARKGVVVERLEKYDSVAGEWEEIVLQDKHTGPAEVAATHLDFTAWLRRLPVRLRRIAKILATGETTTATAKKFNVCPGRISQIRKELLLAWQAFQGEQPLPSAVA